MSTFQQRPGLFPNPCENRTFTPNSGTNRDELVKFVEDVPQFSCYFKNMPIQALLDV